MNDHLADQRPSEVQLEIMGVLWEKGEAGITEIASALSQRRTISRQSVMILIHRLEKRGWLKRRPEGNAFLYRATRSRDEVAGAMASHLVDAGFGGSTESLVKTLFQVRGVSPEELKRLKKLLNESGSK